MCIVSIYVYVWLLCMCCAHIHILTTRTIYIQWQTETGWPICANMIGMEGYLPIKYGSVFKACPGYDLQVGTKHIHALGIHIHILVYIIVYVVW